MGILNGVRMKNLIKHFCIVTKHKFIVFSWCFSMGYFWLGLKHDLSKYSFCEFIESAKYYNGVQSPIDIAKRVKGYSIAWQHHKGHNKHHWEYWLDKLGTKENIAIKMPFKHVVEMFCDFIGAGKSYSKKYWNFDTPITYHNATKQSRIFNDKTLELFEVLLNNLSISKNKRQFIRWFKTNKKILMESYNV